MRPRLYFAAPLFSEAELAYNELFALELAKIFTVYLPQRDGCLIVDLVRNFGIPWNEAATEVFERDKEAVKNADLFVLLMDGRSVDEGAAFELGYAHALGKVCWGLKTDPRQLLPYGDNPMLLGGLDAIFHTRDALVSAAQSWAKEWSAPTAVQS